MLLALLPGRLRKVAEETETIVMFIKTADRGSSCYPVRVPL